MELNSSAMDFRARSARPEARIKQWMDGEGLEAGGGGEPSTAMPVGSLTRLGGHRTRDQCKADISFERTPRQHSQAAATVLGRACLFPERS